MKNDLFIFDTNSLVSAVLSPKSTNAKAIILAESIGEIVFSDETFLEFSEVLLRKKFDKYFSFQFRKEIIERTLLKYSFLKSLHTVTDCRDPKDNKFLELAVSIKAKCIISGDSDLLILNPYKSIPIINANDFLTLKVS